MNNKFFKDYSWQDRAVDALMTNIGEFYSSERGKFRRAFVLEASPSGGKSVFSLKAARELIRAGLIDKVFWFAPRESIKDGFVDDSRFVDMPTHGLQGDKNIRVESNLYTNYYGELKNFHGAVMNYQALNVSGGGSFKGILGYLDMLAKMGKRLAFVLDEVHHGSAGDFNGDACANEWGKAMHAVGSLANLMICMSGTTVRSDGHVVPFFEYESAQSVDPRTGEIKDGFQVKADYKFSYKMAIESGVARKLIFRHQDVAVEFRHGSDGEMQDFNGPLSQVSKSLVDEAKRVLFSPSSGHIDDMLRIARKENDRHRLIGDAEAAILVVVGPTNTESGFNPLDHVKSRIKALFGEGAVTVESRDGEDAAKAIRDFKSCASRWICAKDMISEGTSIPRIRTIVILRDVKSQVRYEQLVHRATRNRSDSISQDAIVIGFHLPDMVAFANAIEDEIRLVTVPDRPFCPACRKELEFQPRFGRPCPMCGYEPKKKPPSSDVEFEWLGSEFGGESVYQGGDDFSRYDPISRELLGKLGQNPWYGGRHGINELLKSADENNLISLQVQENASPFTVDEQIERHWINGNQNCKSAAGYVSRAEGRDFQDVIRELFGQCKRAAGMSGKGLNDVRRDYADPVETLRKFEDASKEILRRAKLKEGNAA